MATLCASLVASAAHAADAVSSLPEGVDKATVDCISKGLEYLAGTQRPSGEWLNSGGYGSYPTVMTSLAGLSLLAGGSTPESGPYSKQVRKAMFNVIRIAEAEKDGMIASSTSDGRSMYGHGFAMLFLAQCYGMDMDPKTEERVRKVLNKGIELTSKAQSKKGGGSPGGGWIYTPDGGGDEGSVTVTQLQALRACRNAGLKVPKEVIDNAIAYLKFCQNGDGGISYSATSRGSSRPPISVAAITCFYAAGVYDRTAGGKGDEAAMVEKLLNYVKGRIGVDGSGDYSGHYFYTHMYYAEAFYQRGGKDWKDYYPKIRDRLKSTQSPDGSWNGDGVGTTYGTAIACLILQLPYGYLPICQR